VEGRCFSFDIHNHSAGECWLKRQGDPRRPTVGDSGEYPPEMRAAARQDWPWHVQENVYPWPMPREVHWVSGVILPAEQGGADGMVTPTLPANFERWCAKHGCESRPHARDPSAPA
jgi:hypothetical protein